MGNPRFLKIQLLALFAFVASTFVGCVAYDPNDPRNQWHDVYGAACGTRPGPGCDFDYNGVKIDEYKDPYYSEPHEEEWRHWYYRDSYGVQKDFYGYAWMSPSGILYRYGQALNDSGAEEGKDVLADVSNREEAVVTSAGKAFAAKFALSEETGLHIARSLNSWSKIGMYRSRTDADLADFTKRMYGVSLTRANLAVDQAARGDLTALEAINSDVAEYWGTSPETSKAVLKYFFRQKLGQ